MKDLKDSTYFIIGAVALTLSLTVAAGSLYVIAHFIVKFW